MFTVINLDPLNVDGQCLETKTEYKREEKRKKRKETNKAHGMVNGKLIYSS